MLEWILFGLAGGGAWLWFDNQGARDRAVGIAKEFCVKENVQFLDEAIALVSLRLRRDAQGRLRIARTFQFEFSDTGDNRLKGTIILLGKHLDTLHLQPFGLTLAVDNTRH